jgi:hypothetical protein
MTKEDRLAVAVRDEKEKQRIGGISKRDDGGDSLEMFFPRRVRALLPCASEKATPNQKITKILPSPPLKISREKCSLIICQAHIT